MSALYPLRDRIRYSLPRWVTRTYDNICYWLNPRQKWLTKQIPNHWIDKDTLWEICVLEGIKHAVEKDGVLGGWGSDWRESFKNSQTDPEYPEHQKEFDRELKHAYEEVTITLPKLERQLKKAWDKVPKVTLKDLNKPDRRSYEEIYGETDRLEAEIAKLKTEVMVWAVQNRESIWS